MRTVSHWNHLLREVVKFPALETVEVQPGRALGQPALRIAAFVASCSWNAAFGAVVQPGEEQPLRS